MWRKEYSMYELMKQAIDLLKSKVASNLEVIKNNEIRFKRLLSENNPNLNSEELSSIIETNRSLLSENFDFINVQLSLLKFLEKQQHQHVHSNMEEIFEEFEESDEIEDYFDATISGKLTYNAKHPLFFDDEFYYKLMSYYQSIEEYSMCKEILRERLYGSLN